MEKKLKTVWFLPVFTAIAMVMTCVVASPDDTANVKLLQQAASEGVTSFTSVKTLTIVDTQDKSILQGINTDNAFAIQILERIEANDAAGLQLLFQKRLPGAHVTVKSARKLDGLTFWTNCSETTAQTGQTVQTCTTTCISLLKRCNGHFFNRASGTSVY